MILDNNKKITNIKYNHLNLPSEININEVIIGSNGVPTAYPSKISYLYRADGVKIPDVVDLQPDVADLQS